MTDDRPKALVPVGGHTILERAVRALAAHGVQHLVVATGYREDALQSALSSAPMRVSFRKNPQFDSTQNSVSLALCRDLLEGSAFLRLDGDLLFDPEILARLDRSEAPLAAAIDRGRMLDEEAMKVRVEGARILAFGKGIPLSQSAGESIGIERVSAELTRPLFDALDTCRAAGETHLYYEDVYSRLIEKGQPAECVDVSGLPWAEVDCMEDLRAAEALFGP